MIRQEDDGGAKIPFHPDFDVNASDEYYPTVFNSVPLATNSSQLRKAAEIETETNIKQDCLMVEAAGVEPASQTNLPAATTCLVRRDFSAVR